jgi:hypothetical protein
MPKYRILIDAQNFLIEVEGAEGKYGFFTSRFVEANDPVAAESAAVQMLRKDAELRGLVRNGPDDPPVIHVEEITEFDPLDGIKNQPGRVWYEMNPKEQ